ncbi:hypothetical protein NE865_01606 [Phthorimaea operculella]|nr:hypothetical protein NE865_01606 [Phthorimaea operculella]
MSKSGQESRTKAGGQESWTRTGNIFTEKALDFCLTDGLIKSALGGVCGALASTLFLRKKTWPIATGCGMGLGASLSNCRFHYDSIVRAQEQKEKQAKQIKKKT